MNRKSAKKRNNASARREMTVWVDNGLPSFRANPIVDHVFRFKFSASVTVAVTWQRLGELVVLALSPTTSTLIWNRVKLHGIRMLGTAEPCDLSCTWSGSNSGSQGNAKLYSDSSVGSSYIAKLPKGPAAKWLKPPVGIQTAQWQVCTSANTATAFIITAVSGTFIDVHVTYSFQSLAGDNNAPSAAISGATAGDVIYLGLDGTILGSSQVRPIGPTAIA